MTLGGYEVNTLSATLERLALATRIVTLARDLEREKGRDSFESAKLTTGEFNEP